MRVMVLGASGTTGSAVASTLSARGWTVFAGVRDASAATVPAGVRPVSVDLTDPATLTTPLCGLDALYALSPLSARMVAEGLAVHDAACAAGVRHVVRLSILGELVEAELPLAMLHDALDRDLTSRPALSTILRPSGFMQNFLGMAATIREGAFYLANGDGLAASIDVADIARSVASALEGRIGGTFDLTGPESLTNDAVASIFTRELGRPVRHVDVPPDTAAGAMRSAGLDPWVVDRIVELQQAVARGIGSGVADGVRALTGAAAGDFRTFVRRSRACFL